MDDRTNRGQPDRSRINLEEDYEVQHWTRELDVTEPELREAVRQVGSRVGAVRAYLGKG